MKFILETSINFVGLVSIFNHLTAKICEKRTQCQVVTFISLLTSHLEANSQQLKGASLPCRLTKFSIYKPTDFHNEPIVPLVSCKIDCPCILT